MNETNIELQLIEINKKLNKITSPFRIASSQFLSGFFHSLGNFVGTILLTLLVFYIISAMHINFGQMLTKYIQGLIPKPQFTIQNPFAN